MRGIHVDAKDAAVRVTLGDRGGTVDEVVPVENTQVAARRMEVEQIDTRTHIHIHNHRQEDEE